MSRMLWCVLALVCVPGGTGASFTGSDDTPAPQQLIESLNESANVSKLLPYQLKADLVLTPDQGIIIKGQITYFRDRDRDRIDITAGEYHETRIRFSDKVYVAGTRNLALPRRNFLEALEREWMILYPNSCCLAFGKVERKKTQGANSYCFVVDSPTQRPKRLCVDRDSKSLLEISARFETIHFLGYRTRDGLQYPSTVQVIDDGKMFLEIQNIEIRKGPAPPESFTAPPNSQEFENCSDLESPHALHLEMPKVPSRWHSSYGSVYGLVQADGSFTDIAVEVSRANPGFAQALKEAAAQWKFSPALCGSKAVVHEEQMELHN
ncbi:MAG TPA: hypothetical protein VKL40_12620 [Candidatus Angelobacter sp.]|nr:hypothetical protein [Candidatus Angelobacter sp.]